MHRIGFCILAFICSTASAAADGVKPIRLETGAALRAVWVISETAGPVSIHAVMIAGEADASGPEGVAHYLEHLIYAHANEAAGSPVHGDTGNAWVTGAVTLYFFRGDPDGDPGDVFDAARRLLDPPALDPGFMRTERDIILREYETRAAESSDHRARAAARRALLPSHPAARRVLGSRADIQALTPDAAVAFHRTFYTPANMVLLVTGDIHPHEVALRVKRRFDGVPAGSANAQAWRDAAPGGDLDQKIVHRDRYVAHESVLVSALADWPGTGNPARDRTVAEVAERFLSSPLPGSLAKRLRFDDFIFSRFSFSASMVLNRRVEMHFAGRPDIGVSRDRAASAFWEALTATAHTGVREEDVQRTAARMIGEVERRARDSSFAVHRLIADLAHVLEPRAADAYIDDLRSVTKVEVDGFITALAGARRRVTTHLEKQE